MHRSKNFNDALEVIKGEGSTKGGSKTLQSNKDHKEANNGKKELSDVYIQIIIDPSFCDIW